VKVDQKEQKECKRNKFESQRLDEENFVTLFGWIWVPSGARDRNGTGCSIMTIERLVLEAEKRLLCRVALLQEV